jgi:hypothetical protein
MKNPSNKPKKTSDKLKTQSIYCLSFKIWISNKKPVKNQWINKKPIDKPLIFRFFF